MLESIFSKNDFFGRNNSDEGYTYEQALAKKAAVDDAHGVGRPESKWRESVIERDPNKRAGYRVVIRTIN